MLPCLFFHSLLWCIFPNWRSQRWAKRTALQTHPRRQSGKALRDQEAFNPDSSLQTHLLNENDAQQTTCETKIIEEPILFKVLTIGALLHLQKPNRDNRRHLSQPPPPAEVNQASHSPLTSFLRSLMISSRVLSIVCSTIIGSASTPTLNFGAAMAS